MIRRLPIIAAIVLACGAMQARAHAEHALPTIQGVKELSALIDESTVSPKPLVLHFFATWCDPCVEEMPKIRTLSSRLAKQGVRLVLLSLDEPGDAAKVVQFLKQHRVSAEAYLLDEPDADAVTQRIDPAWEASLPATFVFKKGKRTASFIGPLKNARVLDPALR